MVCLWASQWAPGAFSNREELAGMSDTAWDAWQCLQSSVWEVSWCLCQAADGECWGHHSALPHLPAATCSCPRQIFSHCLVPACCIHVHLLAHRHALFQAGAASSSQGHSLGAVSDCVARVTPTSQPAPALCCDTWRWMGQVWTARGSGDWPLLAQPREPCSHGRYHPQPPLSKGPGTHPVTVTLSQH